MTRKYTKTEKALAYYARMVGKPHGHRTCNGGGWHHTEEAKKKMGGAVNKSVHKNLTHRRQKGEKLSEETKRKLSEALRGSKSYRWIADRSKLSKKQERNDSSYREWRKSVRDRDGWKCKMSNGNCLGKVVAHHILPWSKFPELRYEINNGITLCRFHHPRKRDDEIKLSPYFQSLVTSNSN